MQSGSTPVALVQMRSTRRRVAAQQRAVEFLQKACQGSVVAHPVCVGSQGRGEPLSTVIDMIGSLLVKLKEEALAEDLSNMVGYGMVRQEWPQLRCEQ